VAVAAVLAVAVVVTTSSPSEKRFARYNSRDLDEALTCVVALASLAVVLACIQEQPKQAQAAQLVPPKVHAAGVAPASQGQAHPVFAQSANAIASGPALVQFKAALASLVSGEGTSPVRILWLGDSHTAGILWPATFESALADAVGSGGPGHIPLGLAYGRYHGARVSSDDGFDVLPHPPAKRAVEDDGVFGLGGTRVTPRGKTLGITIKLDSSTSVGTVTGQLLYRYKVPTDKVAVVAEGKRVDITSAGTTAFPNGVRAQTFKVNAQAPFEVRVISGNPELFGVVVENERPGLVVDVLGINGARFATPLAWDENTWTSLVRWRNPTLAIIAYGTNEVFDLVSPKHYEAEIEKLIGRIRSAAPDVDCMLAGPTDVGRGGEIAEARVHEIDQMEAQVAEHLGCAYFSPYRTMGGAQGFDEWLHATPPLAVSDRIHLSGAGYKKLGQAMADSLKPSAPRQAHRE